MNNLPRVMTLPFRDGMRDLPEHVGELMKAHKILTHELTYEQAMDQFNLLNLQQVVNQHADRVIGAHLKQYG